MPGRSDDSTWLNRGNGKTRNDHHHDDACSPITPSAGFDFFERLPGTTYLQTPAHGAAKRILIKFDAPARGQNLQPFRHRRCGIGEASRPVILKTRSSCGRHVHLQRGVTVVARDELRPRGELLMPDLVHPMEFAVGHHFDIRLADFALVAAVDAGSS